MSKTVGIEVWKRALLLLLAGSLLHLGGGVAAHAVGGEPLVGEAWAALDAAPGDGRAEDPRPRPRPGSSHDDRGCLLCQIARTWAGLAPGVVSGPAHALEVRPAVGWIEFPVAHRPKSRPETARAPPLLRLT